MAGGRIRTDERLPLPEHPHIYRRRKADYDAACRGRCI